MNRNEFMTRFAEELRKRKISDADEIIEEYKQHFDFKSADGFSEEEVAAKLGDPSALAAQFCETDGYKRKNGIRPLVICGLSFVDLFAGAIYILLVAWCVVMIAAALSFTVLSIGLVGGFNVYGLIPSMPYGCGVIFALSFIALAVLFVVGCIYYLAFLRQLVRSFIRFQHNALASVSGNAALPSLSISPRFSAKNKRCLRLVALIATLLFVVCFMLSYIVCGLTAGSLEFWHVWGWFGYTD